jgi:hypothetical protein
MIAMWTAPVLGAPVTNHPWQRASTPSPELRMDECPSGGDHARVPKQGGGGSVCTKCGKDC